MYSFVSLDGDQKRALGSPVTGVPWLLGTLLESWGVSYFTFLIEWALHPCGCFFLRSATKYGANCSSCMFLLGAYAWQLLIRCRRLFWMCSKDWTWQQVPVPPDSFFNSASVQSVNPNTIPSGFSTNKDLVHIFRIFTDCFTPELGRTIVASGRKRPWHTGSGKRWREGWDSKEGINNSPIYQLKLGPTCGRLHFEMVPPATELKISWWTQTT